MSTERAIDYAPNAFKKFFDFIITCQKENISKPVTEYFREIADYECKAFNFSCYHTEDLWGYLSQTAPTDQQYYAKQVVDNQSIYIDKLYDLTKDDLSELKNGNITCFVNTYTYILINPEYRLFKIFELKR